VVKANEVVAASYQLTLYEQRILLACIAQINSKDRLLSIEDTFEISVKDIVDMSYIKNIDEAYTLLEAATHKLEKRGVTIRKPNPDRPEEETQSINWTSSVTYMPKLGKVRLRFGYDMIPYLSDLSAKFTEYKLHNVTRFKSGHSIRLYEMLMQWKTPRKLEIEVTELKRQLQIEDNYPAMCDFKKRVIDVAIKEINDYSDIHVNKPTQTKAGRVITHLCFTFRFKDKKPSTVTPISKPKANQQAPDNAVVLAEHEALSAKPEPTKKAIDPATKQKIAGARAATK
jgi:plasmid replication initiation protein